MNVAHKLKDQVSPAGHRPIGVLEWPALLRKLDRVDTSYRN